MREALHNWAWFVAGILAVVFVHFWGKAGGLIAVAAYALYAVIDVATLRSDHDRR